MKFDEYHARNAPKEPERDPFTERSIGVLMDAHRVLELKACESLKSVHRAQVICYLRATGLKLALP